MAELNFSDRLLDAIAQKKTPLVVGIDPVYDQLPAAITHHRELNDEGDAQSAIDAIVEFSNHVLKIVAPHVAAVKINSAFFERYYWDGVEAYNSIIQEAAAYGLIVIGNVKRADIANTSQHYAEATLADPDFSGMDELVGPDAVTVNPYLGGDSVAPFLKVAAEFNKGVFILVRTSNPGAAEIQDVKLADGTPLYLHVGKLVAQWGAQSIGQRGYSAVGAVVGATNPEQLVELRRELPQTLFLVPGLRRRAAARRTSPRRSSPMGPGRWSAPVGRSSSRTMRRNIRKSRRRTGRRRLKTQLSKRNRNWRKLWDSNPLKSDRKLRQIAQNTIYSVNRVSHGI